MSDSIDRRVSHSRHAPTRHALAPSRRYRRCHIYEQCRPRTRRSRGRRPLPVGGIEIFGPRPNRAVFSCAARVPRGERCAARRRRNPPIRAFWREGGNDVPGPLPSIAGARHIYSKAPAARGNRLRRAACHARRAAARRPRDGRRRAARPQGRGSRTMIQLCTGGVAPTGNSHSRWTTKPWRS